MEIDTEQLKKKILYRSSYRGTKEMDKILGAFAKKYINELSKSDLLDLKKLLDLDDDNLYNYYKGLSTNLKFEENNINNLFKNFKLKNS